MAFKDILNDAKKKHEEEIAANENNKKLENERQRLINQEFNLLTQKVIGLLEEVKQHYPKFENCIVATPNERTIKVIWDVHTKIAQSEQIVSGFIPDSIHSYPDKILFNQGIKQELSRFFIKVNSDGDCYYCDGEKETRSDFSGFPSRSEVVTLEQVLLGNINDPVLILSTLQKIIANRIINDNFPKIELNYSNIEKSFEFELPENNRSLFIEELRHKLPKLMTENEAIDYTIQKGIDERGVDKMRITSLEYFLNYKYK